jgi:hypothetical protein
VGDPGSRSLEIPLGLCINDDVEHTYKRFLIARKFDVVRALLPSRFGGTRLVSKRAANDSGRKQSAHTRLTPGCSITAISLAVLTYVHRSCMSHRPGNAPQQRGSTPLHAHALSL